MTNPAMPFTSFELAALLTFQKGDAATQSATSLRLTEIQASPEARRAGLSSLLVRGLAVATDGQVAPVGNAGGVSGVLTGADRWVEVGIVRRDRTDAAILVGVGGNGLLVSPRGLDTWDVLPVRPGSDLVDGGVDLARQGVEDAGDAAVSVSVKVTTRTGSVAAAVHRDDAGTWKVATEPTGPDGALTIQDETLADTAAALDALRTALR
ncbi:hypothetical protein [Cellulosimicrobium marinum]|uniref:hypothetical protein n=1 Tax=Cellulosimicrobium marinum TaxID=1638992 RepID=UPI001E3F8323|nr:hypothetical protein [Cellulosimicrobium marinum]MCB7136060.1 hypothetical protein [Cellulosimicrobium marinum]